MTRRTTHRSSSGRKLYAVRDSEGKFEDIQTYQRAHGQDIKRKSKAEKAQDGYQLSALQAMRSVVQTAEQEFESLIAHLDMTPRQYDILDALEALPNASQTEIVEITSVDRSTLSDVVRRMVKKGWVQRHRDRSDARAYVVKLTGPGQDALASAKVFAKKVDDRIKGEARWVA